MRKEMNIRNQKWVVKGGHLGMSNFSKVCYTWYMEFQCLLFSESDFFFWFENVMLAAHVVKSRCQKQITCN